MYFLKPYFPKLYFPTPSKSDQEKPKKGKNDNHSPLKTAVPSHLQHGLALQANDNTRFNVPQVHKVGKLWKRNISSKKHGIIIILLHCKIGAQ